MPPLLAAAVVVLLEGLCFSVTLPVLGYYNESLGGSPALLGLMFALVSGPKIVTNPLFGRLSDRVGRRPILVINTLGTLSGSLLWATAASPAWLAVSRAVTGIFSAQAGLAQAIAADVSRPERRAAAMGVLGAAFGIAFGLGPVLGGWWARAWSFPAVGWLCAAMQLASLIVILLGLRETRTAPQQRAADAPGDELRLLQRAWQTRPTVLSILAVVLLMTLGSAEMLTTLPLVAKDLYGLGVDRTGLIFGVFGLAGILTQGGAVRLLAGRMSEPAISGAGLVLMTGGLGLVGLAGPAWSVWLAAVLMGAGTGLAMPCISSMLSQAVGPGEQGIINGVNQAALGVGRAAGNLLGGWLYQHAGPGTTYASAAALSLLAVPLLPRGRSRPSGAVDGPAT